MRICRYQDHKGNSHYGVWQGDVLYRAEGSLFSGCHATEEPAQVARMLAPVENPPAILCVGLNYRRHAEETRSEIPRYPVLFMKNPAAVQGPDAAILLPRHLPSGKVDYEAELAVVIGRKAKNIQPSSAFDYVAGYTCANDVSARDWQKHAGGGQWCRGKSFDTFCPLGPCVVTADEIPDPQKLRIQTRINHEVFQSSSTADMIFTVAEIIAFFSASTTLLPGTVILTGTPEGVGMARVPPRWLQAGDRVEVEIERIGILRNCVAEEPLGG